MRKGAVKFNYKEQSPEKVSLKKTKCVILKDFIIFLWFIIGRKMFVVDPLVVRLATQTWIV